MHSVSLPTLLLLIRTVYWCGKERSTDREPKLHLSLCRKKLSSTGRTLQYGSEKGCRFRVPGQTWIIESTTLLLSQVHNQRSPLGMTDSPYQDRAGTRKVRESFCLWLANGKLSPEMKMELERQRQRERERERKPPSHWLKGGWKNWEKAAKKGKLRSGRQYVQWKGESCLFRSSCLLKHITRVLWRSAEHLYMPGHCVCRCGHLGVPQYLGRCTTYSTSGYRMCPPCTRIRRTQCTISARPSCHEMAPREEKLSTHINKVQSSFFDDSTTLYGSGSTYNSLMSSAVSKKDES